MKRWLIFEPRSQVAAVNLVHAIKEISRKANGIFNGTTIFGIAVECAIHPLQFVKTRLK